MDDYDGWALYFVIHIGLDPNYSKVLENSLINGHGRYLVRN
jgi:hypothetical protein